MRAKKCANNRSRSMPRPYTYAGEYPTAHKYSTVYGISQGQKYIDDFRPTYSLINLKCINSSGYLNTTVAEEYLSSEVLKADFFTQKGDILVRLSAPYTAVMIKEDSECGYLVPSHFAIIRVDKAKALSEYVLWFLKRESTLQKILQNSSGSSAFGTISSGFLASLKIREIPIEKQAVVGKLLLLSEKEQKLLHDLAKQKEIFNRELVNQVYDSFKRGN